MTTTEALGLIEQSSVVVIYDSENGNIMHIHECVSLRGGKHPDRSVLEREALERAARAGRDTTRASILHVDPDSLRTHAHYKVDAKKHVLMEVPRPKRKTRG